jgi:riboflavin kinase / FMN adenylyltransferase
MQIFRNQPPLAVRAPCVLTIGNFDGVHLGHQAVLESLREIGKKRQLPVALLTFDPHPREYFSQLAPSNVKAQAPSRIQSLRDKACALQRYGVNQLIVAHFNKRLSSMRAEDFIEKYLVQTLQVKHLFVGDDFQFGASRRGNFDSYGQSSRFFR